MMVFVCFCRALHAIHIRSHFPNSPPFPFHTTPPTPRDCKKEFRQLLEVETQAEAEERAARKYQSWGEEKEQFERIPVDDPHPRSHRQTRNSHTVFFSSIGCFPPSVSVHPALLFSFSPTVCFTSVFSLCTSNSACLSPVCLVGVFLDSFLDLVTVKTSFS